MTKYTIDRMEDGYYVLLDRGDEEQGWLLPVTAVTGDVEEGDIVWVTGCGREPNVRIDASRRRKKGARRLRSSTSRKITKKE